jgi:hypothetical protein
MRSQGSGANLARAERVISEYAFHKDHFLR